MRKNGVVFDLLDFGSEISFMAAQITDRHRKMLAAQNIADVLKELGISISYSEYQALSDLSPSEFAAQFILQVWRKKGITDITIGQIGSQIAVDSATDN